MRTPRSTGAFHVIGGARVACVALVMLVAPSAAAVSAARPVGPAASPGPAGRLRPAVPAATEAIEGYVRANPDRFCNAGCGDYYIEDASGFFLSHLAGSAGSVGIYADRYIETTGFRAPCGGCASFYITGPVNIIVTGAESDPAPVPWSVTLLQNYPNPFNPVTTISFVVTRESDVSLTVYDLLGRVVDGPAGRRCAPGAHAVAWDAAGRPAGVYVYEIRATPSGGGPVVERKAMLLLR